MKTMARILKVTVGVAVVAPLLAQPAGARGSRARPGRAEGLERPGREQRPGGGMSMGTLKRSTSLHYKASLTNPFTPAAVSSVASDGKERNRNMWMIKLVLGVLGAAGTAYKLIPKPE